MRRSFGKFKMGLPKPRALIEGLGVKVEEI